MVYVLDRAKHDLQVEQNAPEMPTPFPTQKHQILAIRLVGGRDPLYRCTS